MLMGIGELLEAVLKRVISTEWEFDWDFIAGDGVLGEGEDDEDEEGVLLVTGVLQAVKGVGSIPAPDWKVRQLISLNCLDGEEPNRAGLFGLTLLQY